MNVQKLRRKVYIKSSQVSSIISINIKLVGKSGNSWENVLKKLLNKFLISFNNSYYMITRWSYQNVSC